MRRRLTLTYLCAGCLTSQPDPPAYVVGPTSLADRTRTPITFFGRPCTPLGGAVVCGPGGGLSAVEQTDFGDLPALGRLAPLLRFCARHCLATWIEETLAGTRPSVQRRS